MISGYCEEKYIPLKKIFEEYFLKQEEIGASFAIYKDGVVLKIKIMKNGKKIQL
jgi:hypothetical protein